MITTNEGGRQFKKELEENSQVHTDIEAQRHRGTEAQRHRGTEAQRHRESGCWEIINIYRGLIRRGGSDSLHLT